ncbi:hypothetical protein GRJ2_000974800 [Grus japonensis]|uniref:Uncharacterized protein n=1 Tax=Grus japonensis TaxID=30415 RepID=A0ABC9WHY7_GRUJA
MYHHFGVANPKCHKTYLFSFVVKSPGTENPEDEEGKGNKDEPEDSSRDIIRGPWVTLYAVSPSSGDHKETTYSYPTLSDNTGYV